MAINHQLTTKKNPGVLAGVLKREISYLFYFLNNGLEGIGRVHGEVGKDLPVQSHIPGL